MAQESILFGSIAVSQKLITAEQLSEALRIQLQLEGIGVRKLLGQILREQGHLDDRGIREILRMQAYKEKRLESKDYGRIAHSSGFATQQQILEALAAQKEAYRQGQGMRSLGRILMELGHVTAQQHEAVMRTVNRLHGRAPAEFRKTSVLYGVKECPVCFEMIDFQADRCDRCGAFLGEISVKPECPACHSIQEAGGEYCSKCGADMLTGVVGRKHAMIQCQVCGGVLASGQTQCYHCGHHQLPSFPRRMLKWLLTHAPRAVGGFVGKIILFLGLGLLVTAIFFLPDIVQAGRAVLLDPDIVRLERAFEDLRLALLYGDVGLARRVTDPAAAFPGPVAGEDARTDRDRLFRALLEADGGVDDLEVLSARLDQRRIDGNHAATYAEVEVRFKPARSKPGDPLDNPWAVMQAGLDGATPKKILKRRISWQWRRSEDRWLLSR